MKIGGRNQLRGVVKEIRKEKIMGSLFTLDSLDDLKLKEGDKVTVVAKAVKVLPIKEWSAAKGAASSEAAARSLPHRPATIAARTAGGRCGLGVKGPGAVVSGGA